MTPTTRSRMARCLGALGAAAALLTVAPTPAQAEHRHHDHRRHHGRHQDDDCDHRHAARRGDGHRFHHRPHARFPAARGFQPSHRPAYTCARCRVHFRSWDRLAGHVHHHHRVPSWRVPGLLAQVSFGWTFDL